jgi:hypothetical protein
MEENVWHGLVGYSERMRALADEMEWAIASIETGSPEMDCQVEMLFMTGFKSGLLNGGNSKIPQYRKCLRTVEFE